MLILVLLILILPPTLFLIKVSIFTTKADGSFGDFTLRYYQQLFTGRFFFSALTNTAIYAIGSAVIAILLGTIQAIIVERTDTPGRGWVFLGAIVSLGIPHVLYTVAWLLILGRSGPLNGLLLSTFGPQSVINV